MYKLHNTKKVVTSLGDVKKGDNKNHHSAYTRAEIAEKVKDFLVIDPSLWEHLPVKSYISYVKKDAGNTDITTRFRPGGFIQYINANEDGVFFKLSSTWDNKSKGSKTWMIYLKDTEKIWKKFPADTFIENYLTRNAIIGLTKRVEELEAKLSKH